MNLMYIHLSQTYKSCGTTVHEMASALCLTVHCELGLCPRNGSRKIKMGSQQPPTWHPWPSGLRRQCASLRRIVGGSMALPTSLSVIYNDSAIQCNIASEPGSINMGTYIAIPLGPGCCDHSHYFVLESTCVQSP